jgi:4-hydroxyphenylpyruvate dioxygenase-like putative hemolysin
MASWKEERDRLVAQTLAFVQQVASAHPAAASKLGLAPVSAAEDAHASAAPPVAEAIALPETIAEPAVNAATPDVAIVNAPTNILADLPKRPTQFAPVSERSDITKRVAAFKARQMTLNREREDYYDSVQARIRSSLRNDNGSDRL